MKLFLKTLSRIDPGTFKAINVMIAQSYEKTCGSWDKAGHKGERNLKDILCGRILELSVRYGAEIDV